MTLDEKILMAAMRAEFRLKQRLEQLEWEENTLKPEVDKLKNAAKNPGKERIMNLSYGNKDKRTTS